MRRLCWVCLLLSLVGTTNVASADALRVDRSQERMRVDGALREWKGARFATLGEGADAAVRYALASNDDGLYVGAEVRDDVLVRKPKAGPGQDALVLSLALPDARGRHTVLQFYLYPGRSGQQKALAALQRGAGASSATLKPLAASELPVVEGPLSSGQGYVIEAFVPFTLLQGEDAWEQGRATLRYEDVDKPGQSRAEGVLNTSSAKRPDEWPRIALGTGQKDFLGAFLSEKGLSGVEPRFDRRANVAGDPAPERVVVVSNFLLVYGAHFKGGESYAYFALPYGVGGGLSRAELLDLTGDGRAELITRIRQRNQLGARELLIVFGVDDESIQPLFSVELKKEAKGGFVESKQHIDKRHKPPRIVVQKGRAEGLSATTYDESPARDAVPILLPWGPVDARAYAFDGAKFAMVDEVKSADAAEESVKVATHSAVEEVSSAPPAQRAERPSGNPLAELLYDRAQGAKRSPLLRMEQGANVTGGAQPERVLAYKTQVVVTGGDVGAAPAYLAYGLPVAGEGDLVSIETADLTGDKRDELLVRYRRASDPRVTHELLMVLTIETAGAQRRLRPLVVCEVARQHGSDAVVNDVQVKGGKLRITPGKARGFTAQSYPFNDQPSPGIEPLLLPWADAPRSYRFDGSRLVVR